VQALTASLSKSSRGWHLPGSKSTGLDAGVVAGVKALGVHVLDELPPDLAAARVAIDFSRPPISVCARSTSAARAECPSSVVSPGTGSEVRAALARQSRDIAVLVGA
jgi:dihydrodipicolinate reductase